MRRHLASRNLVLLIVAVVGSLAPMRIGYAADTTTYLPSPSLLYPVNQVLRNPDPPIFHWTGVPGAVSYSLQVSSDPTFSTTVASASTANTRFTPTTEFGNGTYYWRLRAQSSTNQLSLYVNGSFAVNWRGAPQPVYPKPNQTITWGKDSFVFTWTPQPFAASYNVEISTSPSFPDTVFLANTQNLAVLVPGSTLKNGVVYYWRVQAGDAARHVGYWSVPQAFVKQWHPTSKISYPDTLGPRTRGEVVDPVLRWTRIDGAVKYEVQISTDFLMLSGSAGDNPAADSVVDDETTALPYLVPKLGALPGNLPNANYIWHVRGIDDQGNPGPWSHWKPGVPGPYRFTVTPAAPVRLLSPANGTSITKPLLQWAAVPYASLYDVELCPDQGFEYSRTQVFVTYTNALAPNVWSPPPTLDQLYYWRVRAVTGSGIVGRWSTDITGAPWSFVFSSEVAAAISPINGQQVAVPVLKFVRLSGFDHYEVEIHDGVTNQVTTYITQNTSFTPPDATLINDCAITLCYWYVRGILADNNREPTPDQSTFGSFRDTPISSLPQYQVPVPIGPLPNSAASSEMPSFCWQSTQGASRYQLFYSPGADTFQPLGNDQTSATCQTPTFALSDGTYKWFVRALDSQGNIVSDGPISQFSIDSGLLSSGSGPGCSLLPSDYLAPQVVKATIYEPIFSWNPVPCAHGYHIYVSSNPFFTDALVRASDYGSIPDQVDNQNNYPYTVYMANPLTAPPYTLPIQTPPAPFPTQPIPGCTAAPLPPQPPGGTTPPLPQGCRYYPKNTVLYLLVRPLFGKGADGTPLEVFPHHKGVFNGERIAVTVPHITPLAPANGASVSDTPLLHWGKLFQGVQYQVQIGQTPDLSTAPTVDATTFSGSFVPPADLPDGTYYWHVRATISNIFYDPPLQLEWSRIFKFVKHSPSTVLYGPASGSQQTVMPVFTWQPVQRAAQYEIQISNNDPSFMGTLQDFAKVNAPSYSPKTIYAPNTRAGYYYWRVRIIDPSGNPGPWTHSFRFHLAFRYPLLVKPVRGAIITSQYPVFSWQALPNAASYQLEFSTLPDFSALAQSITTQGTAWTPLTPLPPGKYYWHVRAVDNAGGLGLPSVARTFTQLAPGALPPPSATPTPTPATSAGPLQITSAQTIDPQGKPISAYPAGTREVDYQFSWTNAKPNVDTFQTIIYTGSGKQAGAGAVVKFPTASGTESRLVYYYDVKTKARLNFPAGAYKLTILADGQPARSVSFTVK